MKISTILSNILIILTIVICILVILDLIGIVNFPYSLSIIGLILILNYWVENKATYKIKTK